MEYTNLVPIIGTILSITKGYNCYSQMVSLRTENGTVNFMVGQEKIIIDNKQLRRGMRIAAFYDSSQPAILIFPPQYNAVMITALGREEQIMLNYFDRNLLAADRSLQLNVAGNTNIETVNGQKFNCNIRDRVLLVYYTITTRSIPPQTTPSRIIVF